MTAVIKRRALPKPPLPATKEYRYIEKAPVGRFDPYDWDPEKAKKARARSVEARQKRARERSRESRKCSHPRRRWGAAEMAEIERMRAQGMIWKDIARHYGVSDATVRQTYGRRKELQGKGVGTDEA